MKPVLLDTGFIVALLDRSESIHKMCARTVREVAVPLVTCEAVIAESCYLLRNLPGASEAVIENIAAGIFQVPLQLSRDTAGVKQVLQKYKDREIDLADACLICLADEFGTADILTLDQDFAIYRWGKNKPFRMLPSVDLQGPRKKL
jgi:predicted nucleic acid-binding protein